MNAWVHAFVDAIGAFKAVGLLALGLGVLGIPAGCEFLDVYVHDTITTQVVPIVEKAADESAERMDEEIHDQITYQIEPIELRVIRATSQLDDVIAQNAQMRRDVDGIIARQREFERGQIRIESMVETLVKREMRPIPGVDN